MTALLSVPDRPRTPENGAALTTPPATEVRFQRAGTPDVVVRFHPTAPHWLRDIAQRLDELTDFPTGWDGHDARPMTEDAVVMMLHVLQQVATPGVPVPDMVLSPEGGLQVEWHQGGWDVEIEVRASGDIEAWARPVDGRDAMWSETLVDLPQFVQVLRGLAEGRD